MGVVSTAVRMGLEAWDRCLITGRRAARRYALKSASQRPAMLV
jgi:hypothetical protein